MESRLNPLEDLVGDLFVDRHEEMAYFWRWANNIPSPFPHDSHALIGRRRTGKTTMMIKLFNRLYHEQERVMPVYVSFEPYIHLPEPQITWNAFGEEFLLAYLRSYLTFRYREPQLMWGIPKWEVVRAFVEKTQDAIALDLLAEYDQAIASPYGSSPTGLAGWAVNLPSVQARLHNLPTVVMIDEFQVLGSAYNEEAKRLWGVTSLFQKAAETHWAPLLVSGSVVSTLKREIFGGALLGRIGPHHIPPLPREYAIDLAFRLGKRRGVLVNEEMAESIWQITGGSANSITCIMESFSSALERFPALDALEEVVDFELSNTNGKLLQYYQGEFEKYATKLNGNELAKRVLFWTTKYPDQDLYADRIAAEVGASVEAVQSALEQLYQIDVIDKVGWTHKGVNDPMLRRYTEYNYQRSITQLGPAEAAKNWKAEYAQLQGRLNRFVGEVGEVYTQGVMHRFDGRTVDGLLYFNQAVPVRLPKFTKLERGGGVVVGGVPIEIDIQGEWQEHEDLPPSRWLVQVKNVKTPIGEPEVQHFLTQCEKLLQQKPATTVVYWYFSKSGFTTPALGLLQSAGAFYSDRQSFNRLANLFDFFGLP